MTNEVRYFGWEGSTIYSWVYKGSELSARTDITETGNYKMRISPSFATKYKGSTIRLKVKTSPTTLHGCDLSGTFYTDR